MTSPYHSATTSTQRVLCTLIKTDSDNKPFYTDKFQPSISIWSHHHQPQKSESKGCYAYSYY